jgi:excisionase family DNA binding protein
LSSQALAAEAERLAYSIQEAADLLGVDYFSVYRLIQRRKLQACRALRGKLLVSRSELLRLLSSYHVRGISSRYAKAHALGLCETVVLTQVPVRFHAQCTAIFVP